MEAQYRNLNNEMVYALLFYPFIILQTRASLKNESCEDLFFDEKYVAEGGIDLCETFN